MSEFDCKMDLKTFFPYRLAVIAEAVSQSMAQVYAARFELSRDEWRILAALAENVSMKNVALIDHSTLDKMQVSRAVARLLKAGLIARQADPQDGRAYVLSIQPSGRALYKKIEPMVLAREAFLLEGLRADELASLEAALTKVLERARQLTRHG